MNIDYTNITTDILQDDLFVEKQITVSVLRLDKIHPIISGNKLFKLYYFLEEAKKNNKTTLVTFGGAYSNHLAATSYACKLSNIKSVGIVRGEKPPKLSHTLQQCIENGMQLKFVSRYIYAAKEDVAFITQLKNEFENAIIIPEGGYHPAGCNGASLILDTLNNSSTYTHICAAIGTATTLCGVLQTVSPSQQVIGIPVLKGLTDIKERTLHLTQKTFNTNQLHIWDIYHFGGYAKKTDELIEFINNSWRQYQLPLDFVYTGKAFYALIDNIKKDYFMKGSNILFIHTGGLQGNLSLPEHTLLF